jgi:DNA-binding transcriptional ArsR family regulator
MAASAKRSRREAVGTSDDERVWRALSDPSRRLILDLLRERPHTTGELCGFFESTRFAVMKHLKVLEKASLVLVERRGRERYNHINPVPIQEIYRRWIRPFEALPADRLLRIKRLAEAREERDS